MSRKVSDRKRYRPAWRKRLLSFGNEIREKKRRGREAGVMGIRTPSGFTCGTGDGNKRSFNKSTKIQQEGKRSYFSFVEGTTFNGNGRWLEEKKKGESEKQVYRDAGE